MVLSLIPLLVNPCFLQDLGFEREGSRNLDGSRLEESLSFSFDLAHDLLDSFLLQVGVHLQEVALGSLSDARLFTLPSLPAQPALHQNVL